MEGPLGLEPRTPCLKGRCSNQLSYGPAYSRAIRKQKIAYAANIYYRFNLLLSMRSFFISPMTFGLARQQYIHKCANYTGDHQYTLMVMQKLE